MTEEVKRFDVTSIGDSCTGIMEVDPTGEFVKFDDYVAMIQRAERAEGAATNHAALLQRAATALGVPAEAKVHEALIPAVHQVRGALIEKLEALNACHSSLIILRTNTPIEEAAKVARSISSIMHFNVVILRDDMELSALSENDMGAAGWVRKA